MHASRRNWALALVLFSTFALAQSSSLGQAASPGKPIVTGVWRGQMNELPVIVLVVSDEGASLSGAALFYLWKRDTVRDAFKASPGIPEPLLNPRFDGKTLKFLISHRRAHPPGSLSDPPIRFHLTLTVPDKAELVNDSEKQGPPLVLVRTEY